MTQELLKVIETYATREFEGCDGKVKVQPMLLSQKGETATRFRPYNIRP